MANEPITAPVEETPQVAPEEKTNAQLKEELVTLGMPQEAVDKLPNTRAIILPMIDLLNQKNEAIKESSNTAATSQGTVDAEGERVATLEPTPNPKEEKQINDQWQSKARRQWEFWDKQPKVQILVPLNGANEKQGVVDWVYDRGLGREIPVAVSGANQPVTENGAQWIIPKGVYVSVPEPVAKLIQDKYQQTAAAGANLLVDRVDPETGKSVRDQL